MRVQRIHSQITNPAWTKFRHPFIRCPVLLAPQARSSRTTLMCHAYDETSQGYVIKFNHRIETKIIISCILILEYLQCIASILLNNKTVKRLTLEYLLFRLGTLWTLFAPAKPRPLPHGRYTLLIRSLKTSKRPENTRNES